MSDQAQDRRIRTTLQMAYMAEHEDGTVRRQLRLLGSSVVERLSVNAETVSRCECGTGRRGAFSIGPPPAERITYICPACGVSRLVWLDPDPR